MTCLSRRLSCLSVQAVSSRRAKSLHLCILRTQENSINVPWQRWAWLVPSSSLGFPPKLPCCWAGGFRWKSTCMVRMLLLARCSEVRDERDVGRQVFPLSFLEDQFLAFAFTCISAAVRLMVCMLMMDLENPGICFHPCLESLCPMYSRCELGCFSPMSSVHVSRGFSFTFSI